MLLLGVLCTFNALFLVQGAPNPEAFNLERLIKEDGYPVEKHQVTTEDGYILNLHRIPRGLQKSDSKTRSAVLLVHGLGGAPHNFITLRRKYAPAYYLADRGFDVWLFCARGVECQNPKKHKKWDWNKHPYYWDFSFHEVAVYDIAASIDLVLNRTQQEKLFYIGHSSGGYEFMALMAEKPQYNSKIKINANWGATAIGKEMDYPFAMLISHLSGVFKGIYRLLGLYEFLPLFATEMAYDILQKMCPDPKWFRACRAMIWCFGSRIPTLLEDDTIRQFFRITPPIRLSIKQLTHSMDNTMRGDFRKYDYGSKKNMVKYGMKRPPLYNLSACTVPNAFFRGATDSLVVKEDVWETQGLLPNTILDYELGPSFVHLDFFLAKNASHMLYKPTVKLFNDYDRGVIPKKIQRK